MARLVETNTGRSFTPSAHCLVGRSAASQLVLPRAWVSGQHATLRWSGNAWEVRDLGSKNGTWVRDRRIEPSIWVTLVDGDTLGFGRHDETWTLADTAAPLAMARRGDQVIEAQEDLLALPSPEDPVVCVYCTEDGQWIAETSEGIRQVRDGENLDVAGRTFVLDLPHVLPATRDMRAASVTRAHLVFHVSRDLEHIEVTVRLPDRSIEMPHRAHFELLKHLADARIEDRQARLPADEQGWRYQDDVAHQLRIPLSHFNMTIYRARQQFRKAGFADADALLERRRGSGQIRIGAASLEIRSA